jgi:hypothetical protein
MSEGGLGRQDTTLLLAQRFMQVSKELDSISRAALWREPLWWVLKRTKAFDFIRRRKLNRLVLCSAALLSELSLRYEGVIQDLFTCAGVGTALSGYLSRVWIEFQDRATRAQDPRLFSSCLWEIQRGLGATVDELKPKFMLRQFIDDMPDGEPRAALKLFAYSFRASWPTATREAARMVMEGYALLHNKVCARAEDLEVLTGGVLNARMVDEMRSMHAQYHRWLFHEC